MCFTFCIASRISQLMWKIGFCTYDSFAHFFYIIQFLNEKYCVYVYFITLDTLCVFIEKSKKNKRNIYQSAECVACTTAMFEKTNWVTYLINWLKYCIEYSLFWRSAPFHGRFYAHFSLAISKLMFQTNDDVRSYFMENKYLLWIYV